MLQSCKDKGSLTLVIAEEIIEKAKEKVVNKILSKMESYDLCI